MIKAIFILIDVVLVAEALACISGFLFWKKLKHSYWKYLPFYLLWIVAAELMGRWSLYNHEMKFNAFLFNYLVAPCEFLFFFWLLSNFFKGQGRRFLLPAACVVVYVAAFIADQLLFRHGNYFFFPFADSVGRLCLLLLLVVFFYDFIFSDQITSYATSSKFWVATGLFLYYIISFPFYGLYTILLEGYRDVYIFLRLLVLILSTIMYLLFITAFVWGKRE